MCGSPHVLSPNGRRYVLNGRLSRVGCRCWWAQQWPIARTGGVLSPPSSLASTSEAAALLQGEEDGSPGAVVLSNPAVRQG